VILEEKNTEIKSLKTELNRYKFNEKIANSILESTNSYGSSANRRRKVGGNEDNLSSTSSQNR